MPELLGRMFQNGTSRSPHLPGRALRGLAAGTVLALVGCGESSTGPTQANPTMELPPISAARVAASTANAAGVENFHFLPPIAPEPEFTGTFDPMASPEVVICQLDSDTPRACAITVATFTAAPGSGSETIRVDADEEHYVVNWHTPRTLAVGNYRISVLLTVGGSELGYADVTVVARGKDAGVKRGRTLPIKFWIEVADAGDVCTATGAFDDLDGTSGNLDATTGQTGFDSWEYGSTSTDWQMEFNSAVAQDKAVVFARTSSDIAAFGDGCAFTIYADHFRGGAGNLNWAGGQGWFADGAGAASSETTTGVIVVFRAKSFDTADIFLERYDDSGVRLEQITIATDLDFARSTTQRLGADVSADGVTVVVWTERVFPVPGPQIIYSEAVLSFVLRDAEHRRGSLVAGAGGTGGRNFTANFTVTVEP